MGLLLLPVIDEQGVCPCRCSHQVAAGLHLMQLLFLVPVLLLLLRSHAVSCRECHQPQKQPVGLPPLLLLLLQLWQRSCCGSSWGWQTCEGWLQQWATTVVSFTVW